MIAQRMRATVRSLGQSGRVMRGIIGAVVLTSIAALMPRLAAADTVLTFDLGSGSVLAGSATDPPSAFCAATSTCPTTPTFGLATSEPLTGTVSFDITNDTMTFDLTLTQNATFGALTLDSGSSFVATSASPVSVDVSSSGHGAATTYIFSPGSTASTVSTDLILSSGFSETASQPTIPGIECTGSQTGGSCSLLIGLPLAGTGALQIAQGGTTYDGVLSISANLTPVPLPASVWLMLGGLGMCFMTARGRKAAAPRAIRGRRSA
jgi:hypothetical protein